MHGRVEFNVTPGKPAAATPDQFDALAEFITVYPHIRADLDSILAPIDAATADSQRFRDAGVALGSFVQLVSAVNLAAATPDGYLLLPSAAPGRPASAPRSSTSSGTRPSPTARPSPTGTATCTATRAGTCPKPKASRSPTARCDCQSSTCCSARTPGPRSG